MDLKLHLKLSQNLVMTPMLQQAIKLLQLSRMELVDMVQQELLENPVLEELTVEPEPSSREEKPATDQTPERPQSLEETETKKAIEESEVDWMSMMDSSYYPDDRQWREIPEEETDRPVAAAVSLQEYLLWQLHISGLPTDQVETAEVVIGNLDEDGYLRVPLEEMASQQDWLVGKVESGLKIVQSLEPTGVGARDLTECLTLQIRARGDAPPLAEAIINGHRHLLERKDLTSIAAALEVDRDEVREAVTYLATLDPYPARQYSGRVSPEIIPDIVVTKVDDEYVVTLNDDGLPRLRVDSYYRRLLRHRGSLSSQVKDYLKERHRSAIWLIKSINQRQRTVLRVAKSIVRYQREFFDLGINYLKPLVLRDVADDIEMHESTVSRVTDNKYMATPRGVFPMKYFFHSKVLTENGKEVSSETVKDKIKRIVSSEDNRHRLSDQEIANRLFRDDGIRIARRTIAKYRQALHIPSTKERREFL